MKVIQNKTVEYLKEHNNLNNYQSGFTPHHLKVRYQSFLNDKILKSFDNMLARIIPFDLQKAFDSYYICNMRAIDCSEHSAIFQ